MAAVVCWEAGGGEAVKVEEIEVDRPNWGEVRIQMLFASLCHTDVLCCHGFPVPLFPRVLGHEGVGLYSCNALYAPHQVGYLLGSFLDKNRLGDICNGALFLEDGKEMAHIDHWISVWCSMVESVGEGVTELREGDIVIPTYLGECRECENCKSGKTNQCQTYPLQAFTGLMQDDTSRMSIRGGGQKLYHFLSCSTWSEYTVVSTNYVVKVDPRVSDFPLSSFLSCGFSTGFGAAWKEAKVEKGSSVAVLGLGAVGLGVVEGARLHGAAKIIGIDVNDSKQMKGEAFGMTDFINPRKHSDKKSIPELIKELTGGSGVDYSFECTGVPALVNDALEATKVVCGIGKMIMLGAGTQKSVEIDFVSLLGGRTFKYSVFGGIKVQSDLPIIIRKCINKEIEKLDELLTYEVHLEDIHRAFELLKEPDCIKVLIKF
ncbi:hypothetical protein RJ639_046520 [Escallonia herrerae]|uniref:Alcohol dehydrogenase n=1 Tax=Escallonia herrerae TaxID=1293975 RepID=A0AA89AZ66_9ASTE|nr:hypothetical protein RJ639_046520 [Escallonia herrerae]